MSCPRDCSCDRCHHKHHQNFDVNLGGEGIDDRFVPYALTIHVNDTVTWINSDEESHTVKSVDQWNTAKPSHFQHVIPAGGRLTIQFTHEGLIVYRCEFHSHLDSFNQPIAPGPGENDSFKVYDPVNDCPAGVSETIKFCDAGQQTPHQNFGTPMTGVIAVLPRHH